MRTAFFRVLEMEDKASAIRASVRVDPTGGAERFDVDLAEFRAVPTSPFAYWVGAGIRALYRDLPSFESVGGRARQGLATADDFRFARSWWAVSAADVQQRWFPLAKGGPFRPFYADLNLVVNWQSDGYEIANFFKPGSLRVASRVQNADSYFLPGLTWPLRTHRFCPQALPAGAVISVRGSGIYWTELEPLLALLSSPVPDALLKVSSGKDAHPQFDMGDIASLPFPASRLSSDVGLGPLARRAWSLRRSLDTVVEVSHAFVLPALLVVGSGSLVERADAWAARVAGVEGELAGVQAEIDERCFELYGIGEEDRRAITEGFGAASESGADEAAADEDGVVDELAADPAGLVGELVSWCVGVALGRFDVRLATGERELPGEPEPFDPLPVCSPGMLTGEDGLPLAAAPAGYPVAFPEDGVLVDDPGHPRDLGAAVRSVFEVVFGEGADALWQEAAALLDPKRQDLRGWLASVFFEQHLKRHSKSRRKAPIVWQLATPSRRYSVWLYAHRLTEDSLFRLQGDVVAPKLADEERRLTSLVQVAGATPTGSQSKEIAAQESFVEELRVMLQELRRVAPLWAPSLDDGMVLVMAPLWRLVPQHKAWQKELKGKWDELAAGTYDWAQIAMRLWPERVVPKCATDRSLAIAHDLEDVFWVEDADRKWERRATPTTPIDTLITSRTSTTITTTLTQLVDTADA